MNCDRKDCKNKASYTPIIEFMPLNHPEYTGPPGTITINLHVCKSHATQNAADQLINLEFIEEFCKVACKALPDPKRTTCKWMLGH